MKKHATALLLFTGLLTSCAIYAPDKRTDLNDDAPENFTLYADAGFDSTNRWWENFQSLELNAFIDEALTNSPSIQQSWARLAQADAVAKKAGAERLPSVGYDARGGATWLEGSGSSPVENYSAGVNASYEVDLWGRVKSVQQAAALDAEASREQLNTAAITLSSRVALTWVGLISQRLQTEVIRLQLEANKTSLELIELRFKKSLSTSLDVFQQRQTVAGTEALIPRAELNEQLQQHELAVLLGRGDFDSMKVMQTNLPTIGNLPAIGIPANVLANRPDVREAGLKLYAADWQVSAAKADRLPALRLTGSLDYNSGDISSLFDNWSANLAASLDRSDLRWRTPQSGSRPSESYRDRANRELPRNRSECDQGSRRCAGIGNQAA